MASRFGQPLLDFRNHRDKAQKHAMQLEAEEVEKTEESISRDLPFLLNAIRVALAGIVVSKFRYDFLCPYLDSFLILCWKPYRS